jgi:hypothetical protein
MAARVQVAWRGSVCLLRLCSQSHRKGKEEVQRRYRKSGVGLGRSEHAGDCREAKRVRLCPFFALPCGSHSKGDGQHICFLQLQIA